MVLNCKGSYDQLRRSSCNEPGPSDQFLQVGDFLFFRRERIFVELLFGENAARRPFQRFHYFLHQIVDILNDEAGKSFYRRPMIKC